MSNGRFTAAGGGFGSGEQFRFPVLYQAILETIYAPQVFRRFYKQWHQPDNDQFEIPLEQGDTAYRVPKIAEGEEAKLEQIQYGNSFVQTYDIGEGFNITEKELAVNKVPIVAHKPRKLGFKIGNTIDLYCLEGITGAMLASHIIAATGQSMGDNMTLGTLAGTVGIRDVNRCKTRIRTDAQTEPTDLVMNPTGLNFFEDLPQFSSLYQYGDPAYKTGVRGLFLGLRAHITVNCPDGRMIMIAAGDMAQSGQFTPMGFYCYRFDLQTYSIFNPSRKQNEVYGYSNLAPVVTKPVHNGEITYDAQPYE